MPTMACELGMPMQLPTPAPYGSSLTHARTHAHVTPLQWSRDVTIVCPKASTTAPAPPNLQSVHVDAGIHLLG